jgi:cytochrome P450
MILQGLTLTVPIPAIPHVTTEDDVYEGHRIPANSVVIPNCW